MNAMSSVDDYDAEPMSMEMLEDIHDVSQSHPSINMIESFYKRPDFIKQDTLFEDVEFQRKYHIKPFALGDMYKITYNYTLTYGTCRSFGRLYSF